MTRNCTLNAVPPIGFIPSCPAVVLVDKMTVQKTWHALPRGDKLPFPPGIIKQGAPLPTVHVIHHMYSISNALLWNGDMNVWGWRVCCVCVCVCVCVHLTCSCLWWVYWDGGGEERMTPRLTLLSSAPPPTATCPAHLSLCHPLYCVNNDTLPFVARRLQRAAAAIRLRVFGSMITASPYPHVPHKLNVWAYSNQLTRVKCPDSTPLTVCRVHKGLLQT